MVDPDHGALWSNDNQLRALGQQTRKDLESCGLTAAPDGKRLDRVGSLLRAVATNLDSAKIGYRLAERLGSGDRNQLRDLLGGGDWDTVEHAAMSLAVEDVATAMDLCAAIIQSLVSTTPTAWGTRVWDVNGVPLGQIHSQWIPLREWLENLRQHEEYKRIVAWRHAMVHRSYEKISTFAGLSGREMRHPSTIYVRAEDGSHRTFNLPDDLGTCVLLGVREFRAFCGAVSQAARSQPVVPGPPAPQ